ncbi:phosphate acyltransferase PlsX [bacterium]|nr:phosphate acyltransferase PlsX [bacterium]
MPTVPGSSPLRDGGSVSRPIRIAVDAMGGDNAPGVEVRGAVAAAREANGATEVVLVGRRALLEAEMTKCDAAGLPISIVDATDVITMHDTPADAVRRKRGSSLVVATALHKKGDVDGLVSAGNTGAMVAASLLGLGMLRGVRRPAIASLYPTLKNPAIVLDVGALVDCRPSDLLEFAVMGVAYVRHVLGRDDPKVALVNVGEEPSKGNELTRAAHKLLTASDLTFIGNIEGRSILTGEADVIVCDGFVGNVILKLTEGLVHALPKFLSRASGDATGEFEGLRSRFDYAEYGGAPLLGVNGAVIIAHGASSEKAMKNAIKVAAKFVEADVDGMIVNRLREVVSSDGR